MGFDVVVVLCLILVLGVVQSLFGVGLLVFGTPLLLLLGYTFVEALIWLLPASLVISFVQMKHGWNELHEYRAQFAIYALPPAVLALGAVLYLGPGYDAKGIIGLLLLLNAGVRTFPDVTRAVSGVLSAHRKTFLVVTGLVHGATNMGGALLTILIPNIFSTKEQIRAHVAYSYLIFAATQIAVLVSVGVSKLSPAYLLSPVAAFLAYQLVGRRVFSRATMAVYTKAFTVLMVVFGLTLILTQA